MIITITVLLLLLFRTMNVYSKTYYFFQIKLKRSLNTGIMYYAFKFESTEKINNSYSNNDKNKMLQSSNIFFFSLV